MLANIVSRSLFNIRNASKESARTITTPKGHECPPEMAWQWKVKSDPAIYNCLLACKSKIRPKLSIFPRFKKVEIPAEIYSCKNKPKRMSFYEYFSFLLPDHMTAPKPAPKTCRRLLQLRQDICLNPQDWDCCDITCSTQPKEWYGQGRVHAIISNQPVIAEPPQVKPCTTDHMVPRCVIAKTGMNPPKESVVCYIAEKYKEPYSDIKGFTTVPSKTYQYKCRYKCYDDIPKVYEKSLKLTCRWFDDYKGSECPRQMFTRFKSIKISPKGDIEATPAKDTKDSSQTIEIKKGVCGRQTFLRPRGLRNFSTSSYRLYYSDEIDINKKEMLELIKKRQFRPCKNCINAEYLKVKSGLKHETMEHPKQLFPPYLDPPGYDRIKEKTEEEKSIKPVKPNYFSTRNESLNPASIFDRFDAKKTTIFTKKELFSTSATAYKEEKEKQICSGCPGIKQSLEPKPKVISLYVRKCRKRSTGKCKVQDRPLGPDEPPITSPYYKCKTPLGICNRPRKRPPPTRKDKTLSCRRGKNFHTSAFPNDNISPLEEKGN